MMSMAITGCATIPTGGYYGDISKLGTPGKVLATVTIGEGLLVKTAILDKGRSVNLQVNEESGPENKALFSRVLTIGKFSTLLGSGFTGKKNIYYRKRIHYSGQDVFEIDGDRYLISWKCDYKNPLTYIVADIYTITFRPLR